MKKRFIATILSFLLIFECFSPGIPFLGNSIMEIKAYAAENIEYKSGDWTYKTNDSGSTIVGYSGADSNIIIPEQLEGYTVTEIGSSVFKNNQTIVSVSLSATVTTIGSSAFSGCTNLKDIVLHEGITTLGGSSFSNCDSLTEITIPSTLTKFGSSGDFQNCDNLTAVTFSDGMTKIPAYACYKMTALTKVNIPETVTEIGSSAFSGCVNLKNVVLHEGITTLGSSAFNNCASLTEIIIPSTLTTVGSVGSFQNCNNLTTVTFAEGMTKIPSDVCRNMAALAKVNIPETVTEIGASAFYGCTNLKDITLHEGITTLANNAFYNCDTLTSIIIPATLTSCGSSGAFGGCDNLTTVTFADGMTKIPSNICYNMTSLTAINMPETVTEIGASAFSGCTNLKDITLHEGITTLANNAFYNCDTLTSIIIPATLTSCGSSGAFGGCDNLTTVTFADGMTKIPSNICYNMTSLTAINMPETVIEIGASAFYGCTNLENITLHEGITTMGNYAFTGCDSLTEITIPTTVTTCSTSGPFHGCPNLKTVTFADGTETVPANIFRWSEGIETVNFPSSVKHIEYHAFSNCVSLKNPVFPEGLLTFGNYAFAFCDSITSVTIPSTVISGGGIMASGAFCNCNNLTTITFAEGMTVVPEHICEDAIALKTINFPSTITEIGPYAFDSCESLETLTMPSTMKHIRTHAFVDCINLRKLYLNEGLETLENYSFVNCDSLTEVTIPSTLTFSGSQMGSGPFGYCDNLTTITFSEGMTTIPSYICQNAEALTTVNMPDSVTEIGSHAFADCISLADVKIPTSVTSIKSSAFIGCVLLSEELQAGHVYSSWVIVKEATGFSKGLRERYCSTCDDVIREEIPELTYNLDEDKTHGYVSISIADANTTNPISNANVSIQTETEGSADLVTNENGCLSVFLPVGTVTLSIYSKGYKTRSVIINVTNSVQEIPVIGISPRELIEGSVTSKELTIEEAEKLGIDTSATENQHIVVYETVLKFHAGIDWESIAFYWNPEFGTGSSSGSGGSVGGSGSSGSGGGGISADIPGIGPVTVYPISEHFYLVIYGSTKWTKEMFDIELVVLNNSATDTLSDITASLKLPEGLSLAKMNGDAQNETIKMDDIGYKSSGSAHWFVCGESAGDYNISVDVSGKFKELNNTFNYTFTTAEPLQVLAGNALHMTYLVQDSAFYSTSARGEDGLYRYKIIIENVSDKVLYNFSTEIYSGLQLQEIIVYGEYGQKDYTSILTDELSESQLIVDKLNPGDKIEFSVATSVLFDSSQMAGLKDSLSNVTDFAEDLFDFVDNVETAISIVEIVDVFSAGLSAVWNLDSSLHDELYKRLTEAELEMYEKSYELLYDHILILIEKGEGFVYEFMTYLSQDDRNVLMNSEQSSVDQIISFFENIDTYINVIKKIITSNDVQSRITSSDEDGIINAWQAIRNMLQFIPIRYYLDEVISTTLPGSTTEIPYSVELVDVGPQYFGIDSVSKYLSAILTALCVQVMPLKEVQLALLATPEYSAARDLILSVEDSASNYIVKDADGGTVTSVKLITKDGTELKADEYSVDILPSGLIEVIPNISGDMTIIAETSTGNVYNYDMTVIEPHECKCVNNRVKIAPTDFADGILIERCDVCNEIIRTEKIKPCKPHFFDEEITAIERTCTENGLVKKVCKDCGYIEAEIIPCINHVYLIDVHSPTCTAEGYSIHTCQLCNEMYVGERKPALGHSFGEWTPKSPATCENLYTEYRICANDSTHVEYRELGVLEQHKDNNKDGLCDICNRNLNESIEECAHFCHNSSGFISFFWKIINFLNKLFNIESARYCECGVAHW